MTVSEALRGVGRLAVDSSALIDYAEERDRNIAVLNRVMDRARDGRILLVGSSLLLTELLAYARDGRGSAPEETYRALLTVIERHPASDEIAERAAELRVTYGLQSMDALHLATAAETECDALLTVDGDFRRAQGIPSGPGGATLRVLLTDRLTP